MTTPSIPGVERNSLRSALPLPVDGCACTPHEQSAGGVYTEYLLEYEPACPEHSEHLWDPTQGAWVLRSERDAARAEVKRLREGIEALAESFEEDVDWSSGRGDYGENAAYEACARRARALLNPTEGDRDE